MDLLEDPEVKKTYNKCKYIVKIWEHKFIKKYNRMPSKLDIREAPTEVRHAYRKYFQLKTAALEQSFMDVEGFENVSQSQEDEDADLSELQLIQEYTENEKNKLEQGREENGFSTTSFDDIKEGNIELPDKIWGTHLNKNVEAQDSKSSTKERGASEPVQSITKKLFCGSKFNKRNPRKSLSFSQKKNSEVSIESPVFFSQPAPTFSPFKSEEALRDIDDTNFPMLQPQNKDRDGKKEFALSVPINIVESLMDNKERLSTKKVDTGWLKRVTESVGTSLENTELATNSNDSNCGTVNTKLDYDSDELIENSDEENNVCKRVSFHVAKKFKPSVSTQETTIVFDTPTHCDIIPITKEILSNNSKPEEILEDNTKLYKEQPLQEIITEKPDSTINVVKKKPRTKLTSKPKEKSKKTRKKQGKSKLKNTSQESSCDTSLRRSSRSTAVKTNFEELSSGEEDPFGSDNDEQDPEFIPNNENQSAIKKALVNFDESFNSSKEGQHKNSTPKNKKTTKKGSKKQNKTLDKKEQSEERSTDEPNMNYELEFSIKRRIVKPRYNTIKKLVKEKLVNVSKDAETDNENKTETPVVRDKKQQAKDKLEQKVASGTLNDNYVTLNLRKKVFVRGKKTKNFSKMKKAMWKSKKKALYGPDMDMGGCDGGKLTCFNCGKEGHFARQCKAEKGDGLLPLTVQQEEDCPYPTLEEASKMASESILNIRKPKGLIDNNMDNKKKENNKGEIDEEEAQSEDKSDEVDADDDEWPDGIDSETLLSEMIKLEEYVKQIDVQAYMDNIKIVSPYYELNKSSTVIDTPKEIFEALSKFGHSTFRGGQEKAIMRILSGKSTLVTLSTGSGKSLCYQLPAYLYSQREPCISLVISPLVSLMEDQVTGIPKFLKAACLHTNQTKTQRQKIMEALSKGDISVLLISPEAVVAGEKQTGFGSLLRRLPPIAFACIDEAHCVSQWSHNFRPSYLMISRVLKESLGVRTILGLTATATRATCESIINSLDIPDGLDGIISDIPLPDNLFLTASKDANRDRALINLLLSDKFKSLKSIIVYCTRRDECERIASFLRTSLKYEAVVEVSNKKRKRLNLQAEPYHAGLSASRRKTIQNAFMSGDLRVVVATVAFGMGINKSDIRAVIHFNMPNSFESYVQEVGRAGRDGLPAFCHVFLDSQGRDENELRRHIFSNSIDRHVIRKLLQKIFVPCACKEACPKHEVAFSIEETVRLLDVPEENISTLLCYLELHKNKYIELLNPAYTNCKVISYGGPLQIRKAAKDCPPLAMALALHKSKEGEDNIVEFPVVDVASAMGWESGICKHKLKNLEWTTVNNQPKRSSLSVQFSNLGFRLLAPGNLSNEELDEALDSLYKQVIDQESKALKQLHAVHKTLLEVSEKSYMSCISTEENKGNDVLKQKIREYFNSCDPLANIGKESPKKVNEEQLVNDIRAMICMYRDNQFTGKSLARIFQGIQSPNYPAVIWGRCKFWRSHLQEDFHEICRIATREIIRLK